MSLEPKISVVMPLYNVEEEYLRKSIECILNQTFPDFELIIVNDASTNNSEDVVLSYKDDRIRYFKQSEQGGQSKARNLALREAKGDYIFCVDADDWVELDSLEKTYKKSSEFDLDVLLYGAYDYDAKTGNTRFWLKDLERLPQDRDYFGYHDPAIFEQIFNLNHTCWGKLFKRSFLIDNNLFFYEGLIFEDLEYYFRYMLKAKRVGFIKDHLYYYRRNLDSSTISNANEKHFDLIKILQLIEETINEYNLYDQFRTGYNEYKISLLCYRYKLISVENKERFKQLITEELKKMNLTMEDRKRLNGFNRMFVDFFLN